MNFKLVKILSVLLLPTLVLFSQNNSLTFEKLNANNGLSQNMVNAIVQDSVGFMWFGTKDGLNGYDGNSFVIFRNAFGDTLSITDNYITALYFDKRNHLWVGTRNGLNLYNPVKENFIRIPLVIDAETFKEQNTIKRINEDENGNIWAVNSVGDLFKIHCNIKKFDNHLFEISKYKINERNKNTLVLNFEIINSSKFLFLINNEVYKSYIFEDKLISKKISDSYVQSLFLQGNILWLGKNGLLTKFNLKTGIQKDISVFKQKYKENSWLLSINSIVSFQDSILLLSTANGLVEFNINSENLTYHQKEEQNDFSLSANILTSIFIDKSKNLWIGTGGYGINKANLSQNKFTYYPAGFNNNSSMSILYIREFSNGSILLANMGSLLFKLNKENGKAEPLSFSVTNNVLYYDFMPMQDNTSWGLKYSSLEQFNDKLNITNIFHSPLYNNKIQSFERIIAANNKNVWIAGKNSIINFDKKQKKFSVFPYPFEESISVLSVLEGNANDFWIGTEIGLLKFVLKDKSWKYYKSGLNKLSNARIKSICLDPIRPKKYLWVGTDGGGLNRIDLENDEIKIFTTKDGLPNDVIYGILTDDENKIWVSTNNGLSRFDQEKNSFKNFNVWDGLQANEFNTQAYYKSADGNLYFGGINGLNVINPKKLPVNNVIPNVFITDFNIFNKKVGINDSDSILNKAIGYTKKLVLPYNKNSFSFKFTSLDYTAPKNNKYKYKLEGFDKDWIENGTSNEAYYTNIPPGEYVFKVLGSNNDEIWNEKGISLAIFITPPFWLTYWAYIIYIIVVLSIIYLIYRYERNKFISAQLIQISEIEKNKLKELNDLKSKFLTNITHEFRTPLTLVIGPIEELLKTEKNASNRKNLERVRKNAEQLFKLVNQLLDLAHLEEEKIPIKNTLFNLVKFVKQQISLVHPIAMKKKLKINFVSHQEYINAMFDQEMMQKIISNLISNSIKYTPQHGQINIKLEIEELNEKMIKITIEDNGIGISKDDLDNIFNPFFRSSSGKLFNSDGFGIGLVLTKELIELMKGKIMVESEPNVLTKFIIFLPLEVFEHKNELVEYIFDSDENEIDVKIVVNDTEQDFNIDDKIVLIVDDNEEMLDYISEILSNDYKVSTALNGTIGFDKAVEILPDLIISDIMMPNISGYELLENLKNNNITSHIPVILLTAKIDEKSKLTGFEIGADEYITKPFSGIELKTRIKNLIKERERLKAKFSLLKIEKDINQNKSKDEVFLDIITDFIIKNIEKENISVDDLAGLTNLSYSQVYRKIKSLTDITAVQFIQKVRLKRAAELLKNNVGNISEIAFMCGFQNPSYFTQVFKKEYDCTPNEYIKSE